MEQQVPRATAADARSVWLGRRENSVALCTYCDGRTKPGPEHDNSSFASTTTVMRTTRSPPPSPTPPREQTQHRRPRRPVVQDQESTMLLGTMGLAPWSLLEVRPQCANSTRSRNNKTVDRTHHGQPRAACGQRPLSPRFKIQRVRSDLPTTHACVQPCVTRRARAARSSTTPLPASVRQCKT